MIEGFRFTMDARENHQFLPLNRRMYFRHTMVECLPSFYASSHNAYLTSGDDATSSQEDRMILELLIRQNEVKDKLVKLMQRLYEVGRTQNLFLVLYFLTQFTNHRSPRTATTPTSTACP